MEMKDITLAPKRLKVTIQYPSPCNFLNQDLRVDCVRKKLREWELDTKIFIFKDLWQLATGC